MITYIVYLLTQVFYGAYNPTTELKFISGVELFFEVTVVLSMFVAIVYYKYMRNSDE